MNYYIKNECHIIINSISNDIDSMPIFPINGSVKMIYGVAII